MKARTFVPFFVAALAAGILVAPQTHAATRKPKPVVVGTDAADDWGCNQDCSMQPFGDGLGQELTKASIGMANKKTVNFIIGLNSLPSNGGVPEFSRYTWEFAVNGKPIQMSGGFTEYLRGICNPAYNPLICPPPRDPGSAPFFLRVGGCTVGGPCKEVGLVHGVFNAAKATITIPVPLKMIGAKPKSKISPATSLFGGAIYAAPAAFVTNDSMPADTISVRKTFVVPKP